MKNSLKFLDKIIDFHLKNNLPETYVFYETKESKEEKFSYLRNLGSGGILAAQFPEGENATDKVEAECICYRKFTFYIINVDEWDG